MQGDTKMRHGSTRGIEKNKKKGNLGPFQLDLGIHKLCVQLGLGYFQHLA